MYITPTQAFLCLYNDKLTNEEKILSYMVISGIELTNDVFDDNRNVEKQLIQYT